MQLLYLVYTHYNLCTN